MSTTWRQVVARMSGTRAYDYCPAEYKANCRYCGKVMWWDRNRRVWRLGGNRSMFVSITCYSNGRHEFHDPAPREVIHAAD